MSLMNSIAQMVKDFEVVVAASFSLRHTPMPGENAG
jgi:hypothetical protein